MHKWHLSTITNNPYETTVTSPGWIGFAPVAISGSPKLFLGQMYTDFEVKEDSLKSEGEPLVYSKYIKEE